MFVGLKNVIPAFASELARDGYVLLMNRGLLKAIWLALLDDLVENYEWQIWIIFNAIEKILSFLLPVVLTNYSCLRTVEMFHKDEDVGRRKVAQWALIDC